MDQLKDVFKVQRMLVAQGVKNTAVEGADFVAGNIWGDAVILAHVGAPTGLMSVTFGARFRWRNNMYPADFGVKTARLDKAGEEQIEIVEAGYFQDEKVVSSELAYAITDTLA